MGKKGYGKSAGKAKGSAKDAPSPSTSSKLVRQKRNELNQVIDKLLKVSSSLQTVPNASKEWDTHLEIKRLLEQVNQLEQAMKVAPEAENERQARLGALQAWMQAEGADVDRVRPAHFEGYGWGLQAHCDIAPGELVVAVPRRLMLTSEQAHDSVLGPLLLQDPLLQRMPHVALALLLLVERHAPASRWQPYIHSLPSSYSTVLYFSTQELQELKGSPSFEPALKHCRNIARQYAYFSKLFQNSADPASDLLRDVFTYEEYRWAVSTVMTRHNQIPAAAVAAAAQQDEAEAPEPVSALIPLWDLGNHSDDGLQTDFAGARDCCECRCGGAALAAGTHVLLRYGTRPSAELLLHGGWAPAPGRNAHDRLPLALGLARGDALRQARLQLLAAAGLHTPLPPLGLRAPQLHGDPLEPPLRAFLRVFAMRREHLEWWLSGGAARAAALLHPDCALDADVEARAWSFLRARAELLLAAYPTSLEEDMALLDGVSLSPCARLAVTLRASEKTLLVAARDYAAAHINS